MRNHPSIVPALVFGLLLSLSSPSELALAQGDHCDPGLRVDNNPNGYRLRGARRDRCEGIYFRGVQASALQVVSLTEWVEDFDPATNQNLLVQWAAPAKTSVRLRAYSLKRRQYYRMDSLRPADSTSYVWSPDLLAALNLKKDELGLVAWMSQPVGTNNRDVYLPVRLTQRAAANRSDRYELVLLSGVELSEVFVSLAPVRPDGSTGTYLKRGEALGFGIYPAERGIPIPIPKPGAPGIYYLEIGATLKPAGSSTTPVGSSTTKVWFYHHD